MKLIYTFQFSRSALTAVFDTDPLICMISASFKIVKVERNLNNVRHSLEVETSIFAQQHHTVGGMIHVTIVFISIDLPFSVIEKTVENLLM